MKPVCLVIGAGAGIGGTVGKRFARAGYHSVLCRRSDEAGLQALVEKPGSDPVPANWATNGYMDRLPVDPWGQPYQYLAPGVHGDFDIFSYGADGAPGGSGPDADIGSWGQS